MNIYLENGDINTVGITLVCVAFIVLVFILLSIFGKYLIKDTDEEIEEYLEHEQDIKISKIPKTRIKNKKNTNRIKSKRTTVKSETETKPKVIPKVEKQENVSKPIQEGRTKGNMKPKKTADKKRKAPAPKPIKNIDRVKPKTKYKEEAIKKKAPIIEDVKEKDKAKEIEKPTSVKSKDNTKKVKNPVIKKEKDKDKVNNFKEHLEAKEIEKPKEVNKESSEKVDTVDKPSLDTKKDIEVNPKTNEKILKVGLISYSESISLNEAEKKMLLSIRNPNERGHIFQFHKGQKIMDFSIKMGTQNNRIKKLIDDNKNNNGDYTVYLIWDKKFEGRYFLENKLLYNPNISYS